MALNEQSFVVVDTETTGTDPTEDRIIEIGAVRIEGGLITERFEQLVDPERPLPSTITRLTGIRPEMLAGEPVVGPVLERFREWVGDAHLVAHNAGFDQRFLALEALRTDARAAFEEPFLCTLRLARRLLPGLPSKGLDALKEFYGLSIERRHRALDDADLTGRVLIRLMPHAETLGARDAEALRRLQVGHYATSGAVTRRLEKLRTGLIANAPVTPGVYRFFDGKGRLLYIGKARSLRHRLRQYVVAVEALPPRTRKMMTRIHDISWTQCDTELEAMLHESHAIKEDRPRHNRAMRTYRKRPFLRLEEGEVSLRTVIRRDGACYHGPMSGALFAKVMAEVLEACFDRRYTNRPLIRNPLDRERREHMMRAAGWLSRCAADPGDERSFLMGNVAAVQGRMTQSMQDASADFDFEAAATLRDWSDLLQRRAQRPGPLAPRVFDRDAVLIARMSGGRVEMVALRSGLPVAFATRDEDLDRLLASAFDGAGDAAQLGREEAESAHVVAHWSHLHRSGLQTFRRQEGESLAEFGERVREGVLTPA
ncbi:MAG: GIY-YIG nuclease family protein [Rhodothermales bacterium]|nr:GIY-YIG nuclease family protein [Rhodothermales bacterium]